MTPGPATPGLLTRRPAVRGAASLSLFFAVALTPTALRAEEVGATSGAEAPKPTPADVAPPALEAGAPALATTRYLLGRKLYAAGDYQGAVREFGSALDIFPTSAKLAFNLGRSCERLNDDAGALRAYRRYLANAPDAPDREPMERLVAGLEKRILATHPVVTVTSVPTGASVPRGRHGRGCGGPRPDAR